MLTLVDSELAARTWLRTEAHLVAVNADRVFFGTPQAYDKSPPDSWVNVSLPSEIHAPDDMGFQQALIQADCWGKTKQIAAAVALAVQTAARQLTLGVPVHVGSAVIVSGDAQQRRWVPDPTTNTPRYVVDLLLDIRGAEA